ncbi:DUF397 domain-containing protein [Actinoplanes sp. TRM 88003]|uniref:DUF397 domain-containing protein n=1 Tax=Paractinoplanes aksuensis TaxID=2939490 RepID=A0ABT1DSV4_9ACTN|nr:DUF397 domain-containing protein [Actinoplanes aksuensis]MCO8273583.1 DUF397 domain-containing protein [Actinoplanes aksuensis]
MDLPGARWHKSTRSGTENCVEVAENLDGIVAVRDTKSRNSGTLIFTDAEWQAFVSGVKNGEFDL